MCSFLVQVITLELSNLGDSAFGRVGPGKIRVSEPSIARIKPSVGSAARSRDAEWMHGCFQEKNPNRSFLF